MSMCTRLMEAECATKTVLLVEFVCKSSNDYIIINWVHMYSSTNYSLHVLVYSAHNIFEYL